MPTRGVPQDLDDESLRRIARSFYVVRMARYALLLVAALVVAGLSAASDAPGWVSLTLVGLAVAFVVCLVATRWGYVRSRRRPAPGSASSPSPTG